MPSDEIERTAEEKNESDNNTRHRAIPVVYRQMASRAKSLLKFTQQSDFDRNYDRVATELSTLIKDPNDLNRLLGSWKAWQRVYKRFVGAIVDQPHQKMVSHDDQLSPSR